MDVKAIVLDFDGVMVESNKIKHEAFSEIFSQYPEHYEEMMSYHLSHNHVHRRDKFKHIYENILKKKYRDEDIEKLANRFSELTRRKIIESDYVDGAMEFMEYFYGRVPLYLASATPLDELEIILKERGIAAFFRRIYGAPMKKKDMFSDILEKEEISSGELLFIGDSPEDYRVAKDSGIKFVARISDSSVSEGNIVKFNNMKEIRKYLVKEAVNGLSDRTVPA